jgi:hypothetical protein
MDIKAESIVLLMKGKFRTFNHQTRHLQLICRNTINKQFSYKKLN